MDSGVPGDDEGLRVIPMIGNQNERPVFRDHPPLGLVKGSKEAFLRDNAMSGWTIGQLPDTISRRRIQMF